MNMEQQMWYDVINSNYTQTHTYSHSPSHAHCMLTSFTFCLFTKWRNLGTSSSSKL